MRLVCVLFTFENNTGPTDGPTDLRTDTTSYRDATAHLKSAASSQLVFRHYLKIDRLPKTFRFRIIGFHNGKRPLYICALVSLKLDDSVSVRRPIRRSIRQSVGPSLRQSGRPSVRPSHTHWTSEKWARIKQNRIRKMKLCRLKVHSDTST